MAKTTTKKKRATPVEAARLKVLERERLKVEKHGKALLDQMEQPTSLTKGQFDALCHCRAELVAGEEFERDAKEAHQRAREIRDGKAKGLHDLLAELFPLPERDDDPNQGKLAYDQATIPDGLAARPIHDVGFLSQGLVDKLTRAKLNTVGKLYATVLDDPAGWYKKIKGIGDRVAVKTGNQLKAWVASERKK